MTDEDEAFEDLAKRQGDWGLQGSRKHQIMRYENDAMRKVQRLGQEIEQKIGCVNHDCDQCKEQRKPLNWEPIQEFWRNNSNIDWDELESAIKQAAHDIKENT